MIFALPGNVPFTPTRWQPRIGSQRWFGISIVDKSTRTPGVHVFHFSSRAFGFVKALGVIPVMRRKSRTKLLTKSHACFFVIHPPDSMVSPELALGPDTWTHSRHDVFGNSMQGKSDSQSFSMTTSGYDLPDLRAS